MKTYNVVHKQKALKQLEALGVDFQDRATVMAVSKYAHEAMIAADYEEMLTEYRTKMLLEGMP